MRFQPLASCFFALLGEAAADSLRSVLSSHSSFSDLYSVLHFHDLLKDIDRIQNATYFAPNNDALKYLADFGINLTTADPSIARALLYYGLIEGQYSVESILQDDDIQLVQSALHPPLFTNVTDGQALKLRTKKNVDHSTVVLETGLQVLTKLAETDIRFDHGVLHGTSTNMVLPHNISETLNLGNLHEFLRLVKVTDLVPELESLADVTFLFPHDKAIQKLRPVLDILSPIQLATFVRNHAIPNHVLYGKVIGNANKTLETVAGGSATIRRCDKGQAYVNDISIVREDILIYGGVAHIVDDVLFPDPHEVSRSIWSTNSATLHDESGITNWGMSKLQWVGLLCCGLLAAMLLLKKTIRKRHLLRRVRSEEGTDDGMYGDYKVSV